MGKMGISRRECSKILLKFKLNETFVDILLNLLFFKWFKLPAKFSLYSVNK